MHHHDQIPVLEQWEEILRDVEAFFNAEAAVDTRDAANERILTAMFDAALPPLARRLCELGAAIGPTRGDTSASVMICHYHDQTNGIIGIRVLESFPHYGMDRYVSVRDHKWQLHVRQVHYLQTTRQDLNQDVVARALIDGHDVQLRVPEGSSTESERRKNIVWIDCIVPANIDLERIRPGTVVGMNIDFYNDEPLQQTLYEMYSRRNRLKEYLSTLYTLTLVYPLARCVDQPAETGFWKSLPKSKAFVFTLQRLVEQLVRWLGPRAD